MVRKSVKMGAHNGGIYRHENDAGQKQARVISDHFGAGKIG